MKVWVTKYALTSGITEHEVEINHNISSDMVTDKSGSYPCSFHGKEWWRTKSNAVDYANDMRKKKIASLKKQIKRLEALEF